MARKNCNSCDGLGLFDSTLQSRSSRTPYNTFLTLTRDSFISWANSVPVLVRTSCFSAAAFCLVWFWSGPIWVAVTLYSYQFPMQIPRRSLLHASTQVQVRSRSVLRLKSLICFTRAARLSLPFRSHQGYNAARGISDGCRVPTSPHNLAFSRSNAIHPTVGLSSRQPPTPAAFDRKSLVGVLYYQPDACIYPVADCPCCRSKAVPPSCVCISGT